MSCGARLRSCVFLLLVGCSGSARPGSLHADGARASKVAPPDPEVVPERANEQDPCVFFPDCEFVGACTSHGEQCIATRDSDCAASESCLRFGECTARDGRCFKSAANDAECLVPAPGQKESVCVGRGACTVVDSVCKATDLTRCPIHDDGGPQKLVAGRCERDAAVCASICASTGRCYFDPMFKVCREPPKTEEDCTYECAVGRCTVRGGACVVGGAADCMRYACPESGLCHFENGRCLATDQGCRATLHCDLTGKCHALRDHCVAKSDADCAASRACQDQGRCVLRHGRCAVSPTPAP